MLRSKDLGLGDVETLLSYYPVIESYDEWALLSNAFIAKLNHIYMLQNVHLTIVACKQSRFCDQVKTQCEVCKSFAGNVCRS